MASAFDRSDPAAAQAILERLIPGDEERALFLRIMAELADAAGSVNPESWSVTLDPRRVSLNVGMAVILRLGQDGLHLAADEALLAKLRAKVSVGASTFEFRILSGVGYYGMSTDLDSLAAIDEVSRGSDFALVRRAAESDGPWRRAHSPGVVVLLEKALGRALVFHGLPQAARGTSELRVPEWIAHTERAQGLANGTADDTRSFRVPVTAEAPNIGAQVFLFDGDVQRLWGIGAVEQRTPADSPQGPEIQVLLRVSRRLEAPLVADTIRQHPDLADLDLLRSDRPFVAVAPKISQLLQELVQRQRAPRVVKIAVSKDYEVSWDECLARKEIRVGWDEVGDLRQFASKQQFKRAFSERFGELYNQVAGAIGRKANELWTLRELQPGDRVVANRGISEVLAVGEVLPDAYQFDDARPNFKHTVRVEWDTTVAGKIQKQPYWGFTTVDDVSPELYSAIVSGDAEAVVAAPADQSDAPTLDRSPPAAANTGTPAAAPEVSDANATDPAEHGVEQPWATTSAEALAQAIFSRDSLVFSPETISAFMLALQTRRFVILSGISGTGKTQLARVFAELVAQRLGTERNVAIVPVRPDWTDHRGLLGCENVISNKYALTDAVRLMLDASAELLHAAAGRRKPAPFFLILDEMNLARVEHYLADVLSAMESRQPLSLHDHAEPLQGVPPRLELPRNLCLIGTVNVDETTYMFSPKVLDRAFVLELGHVDLLSFGARPVTPRPDDLLLREAPFSLVALDRTSALDWEQFGRMRQGSLRRMVSDLHDLLQEDGRGFGYRVAGELARFVALAEEFGCQTDQELTHALDLAILMKVLPRLHGAQQELERPLCRLLSFACTGADPRGGVELLERWRPDGGGRLVSQAEGTPARLPRSAHKLHRMLVRLRQRGFVSYIE